MQPAWLETAEWSGRVPASQEDFQVHNYVGPAWQVLNALLTSTVLIYMCYVYLYIFFFYLFSMWKSHQRKYKRWQLS